MVGLGAGVGRLAIADKLVRADEVYAELNYHRDFFCCVEAVPLNWHDVLNRGKHFADCGVNICHVDRINWILTGERSSHVNFEASLID